MFAVNYMIQMVKRTYTTTEYLCFIGFIPGKRAVVAGVFLSEIIIKGIVTKHCREAYMLIQSIFQSGINGGKPRCITFLKTEWQGIVLFIIVEKTYRNRSGNRASGIGWMGLCSISYGILLGKTHHGNKNT